MYYKNSNKELGSAVIAGLGEEKRHFFRPNPRSTFPSSYGNYCFTSAAFLSF